MAMAIPVALQNIISVGINLIDSLSVGAMGEIELTAVSLAGQVFFILSLTLFGITGGANVLIAQYWGKKDIHAIRQVITYTILFMLMVVGVVILTAFLFPHQIMSILSNEAAIIEIGTRYLKTVCISYLFFGITTVIGNSLRAVYTVNVAAAASMISICISAFFNYALVFGNFGLPALGITGSALANIISRLAECLILLGYFIFFEKKIQYKWKYLLMKNDSIRKSFIHNCIPVVGNELTWVMGSSVISVIAGHMPLIFTTAYSIYNTLAQISCALAQGCASAASVMVGTMIGNHHHHQLNDLIRELEKLGMIVGALASLVILTLIPVMPYIYNLTTDTYGLLKQTMIAGAVIEIFRCMGFVNNVGILRGGGDAKFVFLNDVLYLWVFCIPVGYLCGIVWKISYVIVFFILRCDDVIKAFAGHYRIHHCNWIHDVTEEKTC